MNTPRRIMWNGTVGALPLREQLHAAATAGCDALTISRWLPTLASGITHLDPFVRWVDAWQPDVPPDAFDANTVAFDADDFFRMAAALEVESFTAWGGFPDGAYGIPELIDAFGALCARAQTEGLRCDLEFIPVFGIPNLKAAWEIVKGAGAANPDPDVRAREIGPPVAPRDTPPEASTAVTGPCPMAGGASASGEMRS